MALILASYYSLVLYGIAFLFLYMLYGAIYRLYFSPIAKFPGPRLAALTFWYEFYYDVIKRGLYTFKIIELHKQYGPIVRINPYELHIDEPNFYDQINPGPSKKTDKWEWSAKMFVAPNVTILTTIKHDDHRKRRAVINPFFSAQAVKRLEPVLQALVEKLCNRLRGLQRSRQPVNFSYAYTALTTDVISGYLFGKPSDCLSELQFRPDIYDTWVSVAASSHLLKQFGWIPLLMRMTPTWIIKIMNSAIYRLAQLEKDMLTQVMAIKSQLKNSSKATSQNTFFHTLLASDSPPSVLTNKALCGEAQNIIGAGTTTTASVLKVGTYHVLADPFILKKLTTELCQAMPDLSVATPLRELEQLPYLSAVISESLRRDCGVSHRLQRVAPDRALQFQIWTIPPGTPVSMTSVLMHDNPEIFPHPHTFDPERWLRSESPSTPRSDGIQRLDRYLVPFSKGARACVGINLAYAELYLTFANVFRRFEMELFETTRERDIDLKHDFFIPNPSLESRGVRVLVTGLKK